LLKVYPIPERTAQLDQRSAIQRFEREISALRKISASEAQNPKSGIENIITAYDTFIHPDGYHYIVVTEWVDGELLSHKLQRDDSISFSERARIGAQMCRGLACAHRAGIVHRNLTPDNVIVAIDGTTKLINFDYAKFLPEQSQPLFSIGTPTRLTRILDVDYMAPEIQSTSYHNVNKESDIYSAGLILSEMFSSNPPAFGNREDKGRFGEVPLNSRALVREIVDVMCACDPADRTELPLYDIADYFDAMAELEPQR
jgi:serine/threonine protein kinase